MIDKKEEAHLVDGKMRGVLLLGGTGSRVRELTGGKNKHLLRVGHQSLAEHSLDFLSSSGISFITVVCSQADISSFRDLLGDGSRWDVSLSWVIQPAPLGTAHAVRCAVPRLGGSDVVVLFGDNLFEFAQHEIKEALCPGIHARLFLALSNEPRHFGVIQIGPDNEITDIQCKPPIPAANTVCTGLMCFTHEALQLIQALQPDERGELDLMALVREVWRRGGLSWRRVRGQWMDVAVNPSVLSAAQYFFSEKLEAVMHLPKEGVK